jgi:hypothetical protein
LPEAGFLQDILPAIVGFGLDMFVPGLGEAVGGALGLSGAAGTGITVGSLTGLATGSLSKGVMAGFGAYGGAGLADSFMGAGVNAATTAGTAGYENMLAEKGLIPGTPEYGAAASELALNAQKTALAASPMDKLTSGFNIATQNPGAMLDFGKNNAKNLLFAGAPLIAGGFSSEDQTVTKMPDNRMITPFVMNRKNLPYDDSISPSGQRSYLSHGVTAVTPVHAASGGAVHTFDDGGSVNGGSLDRPRGIYTPTPLSTAEELAQYQREHPTTNAAPLSNNNNNNTDEYTQLLLSAAAPRTFKNSMTGESAKAFDYLMGYTPSQTGKPVVPQVRAPGVAPVATIDPTDPTKNTTDQREVGGGPGSPADRADARGADSGMSGLRSIGLSLANSGVPGVTSLGDRMLAIAERQNAALANNTVTDPAQRAANAAIGDGLGNPTSAFGGVQAPGEMGRGVMSGPTAANPMGKDPAQGQGQPASTGGTNAGATSVGSAPGASASSAADKDGDPDRSAGDPDHGDPGDSGPDRGAGDPSGPGWAQGGIAALANGGLGSLGGYSDGGRLLRGPGDGVSDSIPATIGQRQPARLADGEFVVPARIVSELGNGSTEAGARQLYAMMDRIQKGRRKTVGKNKVAANTRAAKHLPA